MSNVSATNPFDALGLGATAAAKKKSSTELGQQDFLSLMTAQLKNQDPTKPLDNNEFMSQMAQFSTVSGISDLNKSFATFASSLYSNQSLQAAGWRCSCPVLRLSNQYRTPDWSWALELPRTGTMTSWRPRRLYGISYSPLSSS